MQGKPTTELLYKTSGLTLPATPGKAGMLEHTSFKIRQNKKRLLIYI